MRGRLVESARPRQRELLKQLDLDKDEAGSAKVDAEDVRQMALNELIQTPTAARLWG
jgi:hypothetical protein